MNINLCHLVGNYSASDLGTNQGLLNRTITALPVKFMPTIIINELENKYFCGPLIMVLKELVKHEKVL